jgi:hypothetical protein
LRASRAVFLGGCNIENPVFHRIRSSFHRAFWDSLVGDLQLASPCYTRILRVLAEIRDGISDLAGTVYQASIMETIDVDLIKQQCEAGAYGWESCTRLISGIVDVIQRTQAPKRDAETAAKWATHRASLLGAATKKTTTTKSSENNDDKNDDHKNDDPQPRILCNALEFLLDRVNAMRIDAANARLRLISPVIKDHGIDYERGKFQVRASRACEKSVHSSLTLFFASSTLFFSVHSLTLIFFTH